MGYYMGDYYSMGGRSSFYRGDPFWGFLGRVAGSALKMVTGLGGRREEVAAAPTIAQTIGKGAGMAVGKVRGIISKHPVLSAAGAAAVLGASAGAGVESIGRGRMVVGPGGMRRRHRRMRVTNPKALRRALRRAYGFERIAMKTIHLLHPRKKARFGGFKKRRRAA